MADLIFVPQILRIVSSKTGKIDAFYYFFFEKRSSQSMQRFNLMKDNLNLNQYLYVLTVKIFLAETSILIQNIMY